MDLKHIFHFIHQIERVAARHIHFVDEGQHGDFAQAANFKEFAGLLFDPFGGIDHHDGAIGGGQGAVGVFRESLRGRECPER